jgi:hypothetical protein
VPDRRQFAGSPHSRPGAFPGHPVERVTGEQAKFDGVTEVYGARYSLHDNPDRTDLGGAEELRGQHRRDLADSGRSTHSSATAHPARCWLPPHPGTAPGYPRVTSRTSGMPL